MGQRDRETKLEGLLVDGLLLQFMISAGKWGLSAPREDKGGPLPLLSVETSLEQTPSTADAASLFASSALLMASIGDSTTSSISTSSTMPPATPPTAAATPIHTPLLAYSSIAAATTAEQWDCLSIPEEEAAIPWPYVSKGPHQHWGPARNPFVAAAGH